MTRHTLIRRPPLVAVALASLLLAGCLLGPRYQRPDMAPPEQYRFVEGPAQAESIADAPWWEIFKDPQMQTLIREAIARNLDLRVATARVEEARAQAGVAKSFLYPELGASVGYATRQLSKTSEPPETTATDRKAQNWNAGFTLSWEIDLFGRLRRQNEAAFAVYLATNEARRGVLITLVGDVASNYFLLRDLDLQLEIARQTLQANDEMVAFYRSRLNGGVSNRLELDRAVANRARTAAVIPGLEQQIAATENVLSLLLGRPPGPIGRGVALTDQHVPPQVPAGLPVALLERRPDVVQAEQLLVAANANVGAAKALFFPTINLTGLFGGLSKDVSDLTKSDATIWSVGAGLFQPIFQGGRIKRNYEASKAAFDAAMAAYQKAALNAYREVADSLIAIQKQGQARLELEQGVEALRDATKLARSRYDTGLANYLEILTADQQLFDQELLLAQTRGSELVAFVQFYRALGGGWQTEQQQGASPAQTEDQKPAAQP
jgi:outer membrane protein, multidrug efflux system